MFCLKICLALNIGGSLCQQMNIIKAKNAHVTLQAQLKKDVYGTQKNQSLYLSSLISLACCECLHDSVVKK